MPSKPAATDLPKLGAPAQRALASIRVTTLAQLARRTEREIADLHGMGPSSIKLLRAALHARGLDFAK